MAEPHFNTTHGLTYSPEHRAWSAIKTRCRNPNFIGWKRYGGRGIKVCQGIFDSFLLFLKLVGKKPLEKMQLDRKNNEGHYSCGECSECHINDWPLNIKWSTPKENSRNKHNNRLITHAGKTQTLSQWAEELGIRTDTLFKRFWRGESIELALQSGLHKLGWQLGRKRKIG